MKTTKQALGLVLMGWTSAAGASELTWTTEGGQAQVAWTDGDCSAVHAQAARQRSLVNAVQCTPTRRGAQVELARVGETRFVADAQTGAIHAIVGRETPQTREVFQPFKSRSNSAHRRMVTATVSDDNVTFHVTTFTPGSGRDATETTAVTYSASTLTVVAQAAVEPVRVQTGALNYWN